MMRKLSLLVAAVMTCVAASAQYCGFDKAHNDLLASSPKYAAKVHRMDSSLAAYLNANANSLIINSANGPVYEIPVVIHVLHTGGSVGTIYNPSDAQLQAMIAFLNQTYQATYVSFPSPSGGGTNFPVQFALAKRDANCNTTTGIDRVNAVAALGGASSTNGAAYISDGVMHNGSAGVPETTLKALALWNNNDYYNIWVVNKIDGADGTSGTFVAGYAYFPGAPYDLDGTIMLATQTLTGPGYITLTHEIGHAFSLYHTFEGDGSGSTCPTNTNCNTDGDRVCDTDPHKRSVFNCPTGTNPCTSTPYGTVVHNFMDYSSCQDRFTAGQKVRWFNALNTTRQSLLSSLGATTLGTAPTSPTCSPTILNAFSTLDAGVYQTQILDPSQSAPFNVLMTATSEGGYTSDGALVYVDRACWQRANMTAGSSYTIKVKTGPNSERVRAYIDWNNDGFFNTTTELVFSDNTAGSYYTHTGTINVPSSGITTCTPIRMRVVSDLATATAPPGPCIQLSDGQAEDYSVVIKAAPTSVITLSQTTGSNPSCSGSTLGFTANYTGTPTSPSVKIFVNGTQVSATNTYSSSTLVTGDVVSAKLYFTGGCGADSIVSNSITISRATSVVPTVSIAVTAGSNPGCAGFPITFTATPTNGGTAPTYQWKVNGVNVTGATSSTYSTSTLACNSTVQVAMVSNASCASTTNASSNIINYTCGTQGVSAVINVTGGSNPTCSGKSVTFAVTPTNGGTAPTYQWYINGTAVVGATGTSFSTNLLNNGDSVHVVLTSNYPCAASPTAKSPAIQMTVIPTVIPTVTKAITNGANPGCIGDAVQFTATPANAGTPAYRWFLNGNPIAFATAPTYTTATTTSGDKIWVRIVVTPTSGTCFGKDTAYSDTTIMDRRPVPNLPVISFIGHQLVSDSANVQWWGPAGLIPGATGPYYTPTVQGDYYAVIVNPICGTGKSNVLTVSPLSIGSYNMQGVTLTPNPTTGLLTITWSKAATTQISVYNATGKALMHQQATNTSRKEIDLGSLPAGVYFVMLQDEAGKSGVVRVVVQH